MKKRIVVFVGICLMLSSCSFQKAPELLEPVGEKDDSAVVIRGELYNIESYDSAITCKTETIKMPSDGVVQSINVKLGDEVSAGQVLVSLDGDSISSQINTVDEEIAKKQADNEYMNQLAEYDIQIAELELQEIKQTSKSTTDISKKNGEIQKLKSKLQQDKVSQQQEIANLQLDKTTGTTAGGNLTAESNGTVVYLNTGEEGSIIPAGTVVALIAKTDMKQLFGTYINIMKVNNAHRIYAKIGDKEYNVTNVPYDTVTLTERIARKLPLYSTFYIEDAPELTIGMYASIVVISDYVEDALQIPDNALFTDVDGSYVYKKKDGEFVRQEVKTGLETETMVQITEGLEEGDEVYVKP